MKKKSISKLKKQAWELLSKVIRKEKPTCELCGKPSVHVHHIIPRARGNAVYFNERNLASLCAGCHMGFHRRFSPKEIDQKVYMMKGDFSDVERIKWSTKKISRSEYEDMIEEYKGRLG